MQSLNHQYFALLLEEQRTKQFILDQHIQLELLGISYTSEQQCRGYMKLLAIRILEINSLMEEWLNAVELNFYGIER